MITAILLAGGTGVRMGTHGMPKQFLPLYGKPIICYTIEVFENCEEVDQIIIPCTQDWTGHMSKLVERYRFQKVKQVVPGGVDRQNSIINALNVLEDVEPEDLVLVHDGVRPLVQNETIEENIRVAKIHGNAMTVKQAIETIVVTESDTAELSHFKNRDHTYTLTSPQTFRVNELMGVYAAINEVKGQEIPILDAALLFATAGKTMHMVRETGLNIKITTPEDFYYLRSYLELKESRDILGA